MAEFQSSPRWRRTLALFVLAAASACREVAVTSPPEPAAEPQLPASETRPIARPELSSLRSTAPTIATCAPPTTYTLSEGSRSPGTVSIGNDASNIYVTYAITAQHWWVSDTRLAVVRSSADVPKDSKGRPDPWAFPYSGVHEPPVTSFTYTIPLSKVPAQLGQTIVVAAMAGVVHPVNENKYEGNWEWMVMWGLNSTKGETIHSYTLATCGQQPPPPPPPPASSAKGIITITFDDGYRTTYDNAYPVLKGLGLRANIAVNPEPIDGGWSDYLTLSMLNELNGAGWSIVSHSVTHADLTKLTASQLDRELRDSQAWVKSHGFGPTNVFIVPYHSWGARERNAIASVYKYARGHTIDEWSPEKYAAVPITTPLDLTAYEPEFAPYSTAQGRALTMEKIQRAVDNGLFLDLLFHRIPANQVASFRELMSQVASAYKGNVRTWAEVAQ